MIPQGYIVIGPFQLNLFGLRQWPVITIVHRSYWFMRPSASFYSDISEWIRPVDPEECGDGEEVIL